ncbi:glycerophosphodiester phosphodiesterase [Leeia aquatica]|uniref:glycerophosphodiester phosphodiesterase n=1 Tax=Leeia aquatica TaxID=2725557 RepID=A0A847S9B7_9NEIS|nr:glycerophosphodiester phosphodiesterase [Leeia aquatica]NLR76594.1 glycerophosphodiester phosphodiesterase [Leeia aquatica]
MRLLVGLVVVALVGCAAQGPVMVKAKPLMIAHRGASALAPEHTLAAYERAILAGADYVEPDLVSSKDGVLLARHENEISGTTDVADHPEFASRKATKQIDGVPVTGWFTEDFTLAELKTLRARERIPANRPENVAQNGQYPIPTLSEVIATVRRYEKIQGRRIGIYPETKHPSYFRSIGLPLEEPLVKTLHEAGYTKRSDPILIQSFEVANLKQLRKMTDLSLVQLINNPLNKPAANGTPQNTPYDFIASGDKRTYADLTTAEGLREIARYADGVGPYKEIIIPRTADNRLGQPTRFVQDAHAVGLKVHIWTLRPENPFLPVELRKGNAGSLTERGDAQAEIVAYLKTGIDGFFSDDPVVGRQAIEQFTR